MKTQWWHNKVAYQVYPKSFYDSNGDGIGDIPGIIEKLDYLADLGIGILWISPVYASPLADEGYDISDYYAIDPRFGTMDDMDRLIAEAKKRGISILMDLVVNHCSDEHEWFKAAMRDPNGKYGRYFYLEDADRGLPCNLRSYFGGTMWEPLPGTDKIYLHSFHKKQPDLNWENPGLRRDIYKMINWWLDRGLGGFRIDAIMNIKKALPFKDYPADRDDGLCFVGKMIDEAEGIGEFLGEMRDNCFAPHGSFTVGEVFNIRDDEKEEFIGEDGYFSSMFDFAAHIFGQSRNGWYDADDITPEDYKRVTFAAQENFGQHCFPANIIENHDQPRGASRYLPEDGRNPAGKKMLATVLMMLHGIPFIYQGQEIGMENVPFDSMDQVDDVSSFAEYQTALDAGCSEKEALAAVAKYSRDNARTPMQWTGGENAGFTDGSPWLRVNPNFTEINVAEERDDPDSVLNWYRKLIALRTDPTWGDTVVYGEMIPYLPGQKDLMAFFRKGEGRTLLVLANFQGERQPVVLPDGLCHVVLNTERELNIIDGEAQLGGYQAVILSVGDCPGL
ncbi:MAG: alpha-glucosidase [Clostridiales bacterium]|nr:alpha-glucosidase [Clostridiales bacterium]